MSGPTGTVTYGYDQAGRLVSIDTPAGADLSGPGIRTAVEYEYDALGRTTAVEVEVGSDSYRTSYVYDGLGNITSMVDEGTAGATTWTYDAAGRPESRVTPNGVTTSWGYDDRVRILSVVHERTGDGVVLASRTYTPTSTGEPARIEREDGSYVIVDYDEANRVSQEQHFSFGDVVQTTIAYTYDADGNRSTRTVDGVTENYRYSAGAQLDEITVDSNPTATFAYDGAGRQTGATRPGQDYALTFDPDGNVVGIDDSGLPLAAYQFDGEGRRERAEHGGAERRFLVAPSMGAGFESPHAVLDETGQLVARWVYAGEHAVMRVGADGSVAYFLRDTMGTTLGTADATGVSRSTVQYDAFGNELVAQGPDSTLDPSLLGETRFHGMWRDLSGVYFVRARSLDTETGRFLARDPATPDLTSPETISLYGFANASPLLFRDPTGERSLVEVSLVTVALASFSGGLARGFLIRTGGDDGQPNDVLECLEQKLIPLEASALALGTSALPKALLPPFRRIGIPTTDILSEIAFVIRTISGPGTLAFALGARLRNVGRLLSNVGTPLLVGDGFFSLGQISGCLIGEGVSE